MVLVQCDVERLGYNNVGHAHRVPMGTMSPIPEGAVAAIPHREGWEMLVPAAQRRYVWASAKPFSSPDDERDMSNAFREVRPHLNTYAEPNHWFWLFSNATFVPVEEGESARLNVALSAGAIPVMRAAKSMLSLVAVPPTGVPFVVAPSWAEAASTVALLLSDPDRLTSTQEACLKYRLETLRIGELLITRAFDGRRDLAARTPSMLNRTVSFPPRRSPPAPANPPQPTFSQPLNDSGKPLALVLDTGRNPWEQDFVARDVFGDHFTTIIRRYDPEHFNERDAAFATPIPDNVLVFVIVNAVLTKGRRVSELVATVQRRLVRGPRSAMVTCMCSDEWGHAQSTFEALQRGSDILFHQYYHPKYPRHANTFQIPLGTAGSIPRDFDFLSFAPVQNRAFLWAFIGSIEGKPERIEMARALGNITPNYLFQLRRGDTAMSNQEMVAVYNQSIFVASPRGWVNLDCSRTYEALSVGAIPVVVGSPDEVEKTFGHLHGSYSTPPFLFARTWSDAANKIIAEMSSSGALQRRQQRCVEYWSAVRTAARKEIQQLLLRRSTKYSE